MDTALCVRLPGNDLGPIRWMRGATGLGNHLFPWARCVIAAERCSLPILWPTWPQITLGPILRREPPRFYLDLFAPSARYLTGSLKRTFLAKAERLPEDLLGHSAPPARARVFDFCGMDRLFAPLLGHHALVKTRLLEITRPKHLPAASPGPYIAVHVRLGDFSVPRDSKDLDARNGSVNYRMPIEWYVHAVRVLRGALDQRMAVKIFSDGSDEELAPLMGVDGAVRVRGQSSLKDLLSLSQASALVASGSTFSMWASYLGRMPVVWHPGQLRQRIYPECPAIEVEIGSGEDLDAAFVRQARHSAVVYSS